MPYSGKKLILTIAFALVAITITALSHTVIETDTLYGLSLKYNVPVALILRVNGLPDERIRKGELLDIPVEGVTEITILPGDTLSHLAYLFNISQQDIMALNNLTSEHIDIGQVLKIPAPAPTGTHRILPGESLLAIVAKYGISMMQLKAYNDLEDDVIYPDQLLTIVPPRPEGYKVAKGDSLWKISQEYGITITDLREWNGMSEDEFIYQGEVLVLFPHIETPASVTESPITQHAVHLAAVRPPMIKTGQVSNIPKLPQLGEYFYSKPLEPNQPNVSYWEGSTASPSIDYRHAQKVLEIFRAETLEKPVLSRKMEGWHLVIDPGHGGVDPGAIVSVIDGNGNSIVVTEDEYVYDIALRVYRILVRHGASVELTILAPDHHIREGKNARTTFVNQKNEVYASTSHNDNPGWRPVGTVDGLDLRKTIAAKSMKEIPPAWRVNGTLFVSIHADNSADYPVGTAVLYDGADDDERMRSKAFAQAVVKHMGTESYSRQQDLRVLKDNPADAAVLVEVRNIHYSGNAWALRSAELREQDAQMLAAGILDWASR